MLLAVVISRFPFGWRGSRTATGKLISHSCSLYLPLRQVREEIYTAVPCEFRKL